MSDAARVKIRMSNGQTGTFLPGEADSFVPDPGQEAPQPKNPFSLLDRANRAAKQTEQKIANRPSAIAGIRQNPQEFFSRGIRQPVVGSLSGAWQGLQAALEGAESVPANIGLGIQRGAPAGEIAGDVAAGLKGERPAQLGDIARASGIPVMDDPFVASTLGLLAMASPSLATLGGRAALNSAAESVGGLVAQPWRNMRNIFRRVAQPGEPETAGFYGRVRPGVWKGRDALEKTAGATVDQFMEENPGQRVDTSNFFQRLRERINPQLPTYHPETASIVNDLQRHPQVGPMVREGLASGAEGSNAASEPIHLLSDTSRLKGAIRDVEPSLRRRGSIPFPSQRQSAALRLIHEVRQPEMAAFPEAQQRLFTPYRQGMEAFQNFVGMTRTAKVFEKNLLAGNLSKGQAGKLYVKSLFAKDPQLQRDILGVGRALSTARWTGIGVPSAAGVYAAGKSLFGGNTSKGQDVELNPLE